MADAAPAMRRLICAALEPNRGAVPVAPWRISSRAATVAGARQAVLTVSVFGRRNVIVADPSGRRSICCHVNAAASLTRAKVSRIVRMTASSRAARAFAVAGDSMPRPRGRGWYAAAVMPVDWRTAPPAARWSRIARLTAARTSAVAVGLVAAPTLTAKRWAARTLDVGQEHLVAGRAGTEPSRRTSMVWLYHRITVSLPRGEGVNRPGNPGDYTR